ncbi:ABC-type glycerol-3-phosphate transport system, substrate-binding protein [Ruminococcus sp. YRD2003]|uniref:ABC transporter substrate-binding protein n=1 Tax=Ruminococcus sp. YRD2003 TaxID=1452313 RepID=UPI0008D6ED75|nr:ABC-type glycerol-3-phosphate transport system, substrate-binding protein [Ruminococcus flavefaciens]
MKKTMALLCAAAVLCGGVTACADGKTESSVSETVQLRSYKAATIGMADYFSRVVTMSKGSGGGVLVFGELSDGGYSGFVTDGKFADYQEFSFTPQEDETVQSAAMLSYGKKGVLTQKDADTFIYIYGSDNTLEKTLECGEVLGEDAPYARLHGNGDDGFVISFGDERGQMHLIALSAEGKLLGEVKCSDTVAGVGYDPENKLSVLLTDFKELTVNSVDAQSLSTVKKSSYKAFTSSGYAVGAGAGDYSLIMVAGGAIYGLTETDKVKLADFTDLEFHDYDVQDIAMVSDSEIAVLLYSGEMYLLTEQDVSELKAKEVITMATYSEGSILENEVKYFNQHSDKYKIEYKELPGEYWDDKLANLRLQIISGDAPDILPQVMAVGIDTVNPAAFADLYEFIDNDPDISREDFLPNVLKGMERDGRMVALAPTFEFHTVTAKGSYTGVRENWSVDDFITAYKNKPADKEMFRFQESSARSGYFSEVVKLPFFVDYDNAECHFDSPEFIKLLNFFNDEKIGLSMTEYNNLSGDFSHGLVSQPVKYGNLFVDFEQFSIQWFGQFLDQKRNEYGNDYVIAGYPYDGKRSGSYISIQNDAVAITATSKHKEGAWEFLRMMLTDEYYTEIDSNKYLSFPSLKKRFDELASYTMQDGYPNFKADDSGRIIPGEFEKTEWRYYDWDDVNKKMIDGGKLEPFSQEEYDYFYNLVTNAEIIRYDNEINKIVNEETMKFFDYECTAEECADMIQNRVSLYLSERYG